MAKGLPKSYIKKYGISKKAWAEYRKDKGTRSTKSQKTSKSTRSSSKVTKKSKGVSRGNRILGSMGAKGLVISTVLLSAGKYLVRRFFPQAGAYETGVAMTGAGITAKAINTPGKSLLAPGIVELVSELVVDLVQPGGLYTAPGFAPTNRGYDF